MHRLSPEGQEKLFLLLDKGVFERIGESGNPRKVNVRLICATTEKLDEFLIDTFIRRIPIITNLPSIDERPIDERVELIYRFYKDESDILKNDIFVDSEVMNNLLFMNKVGNVGALKNAIKYSCASSFRNSVSGEIVIKLDNLP
ncbi:sigma 54-interacting transcriptional regulator, partial [Clostridium neonatale]